VLPLGPLQKNLAKQAAVQLLQEAIDLGLNFFDTAESYETQPYLGEAIAGRDREQLILATKSSASTYEEMRTSVESPWPSLRQITSIFIISMPPGSHPRYFLSEPGAAMPSRYEEPRQDKAVESPPIQCQLWKQRLRGMT